MSTDACENCTRKCAQFICDENTVYITDITGTIGKWLDMNFDDEIPYEVIKLLEKAYNLAVKEL